MGRLKQAPSRLAAMPARLTAAPSPANEAERSRFRDESAAWRKWYKTARWQKLRWSVLVRDLFTCQRCRRIEADTSQLVADHKTPHRGDEALFWDDGNLQCMCKTCHDRDKQREERKGLGGQSAPMARPYWFRPVRVPLTIVCGPPGAGKSTYVREHAGAKDVVICFDTIAKQLLGLDRLRAEAGDKRIGDVLRARNELLGQLMREDARRLGDGAWLLLTEPMAVHRQWWHDALRPARIVVLATDAAECKRRVAADAAAGDPRSASVEASIDQWWRDFTPRHGETVIG